MRDEAPRGRGGSLRRIAAAALCAAGLFLSGPGCGILLHPDRNRSLTRSSRIAVDSVILDCLWLFVGVVPGVVALVVDYLSGGMWYQYGESSAAPGEAEIFCIRADGGRVVISRAPAPAAPTRPIRP